MVEAVDQRESPPPNQRYEELLKKYGAEYLLSSTGSPDNGDSSKFANVFKHVGTLSNFKMDSPLNPDIHEEIDKECYEMGHLVVSHFPNTAQQGGFLDRLL
jgi:cysteine synthase